MAHEQTSAGQNEFEIRELHIAMLMMLLAISASIKER